MVLYVILVLAWSIIWGVATQKVIKNKGYDDPLEKEQGSYVRNHYSDWQNLIVGHDGESQLTDV